MPYEHSIFAAYRTHSLSAHYSAAPGRVRMAVDGGGPTEQPQPAQPLTDRSSNYPSAPGDDATPRPGGEGGEDDAPPTPFERKPPAHKPPLRKSNLGIRDDHMIAHVEDEV